MGKKIKIAKNPLSLAVDVMGSWQAIGASIVFVSVISIMEWMPLAIAAMLGALLLVVSNILTLDRAIGYIAIAHPTLGLFFGVMVMIRSLQSTRIFEYLATLMVMLEKGKGNRLLLRIGVRYYFL